MASGSACCPSCRPGSDCERSEIQALEWGVQTAEASGEHSDFWKAATAATVYRLAAAERPARPSEVADYVAAIQAAGAAYTWLPFGFGGPIVMPGRGRPPGGGVLPGPAPRDPTNPPRHRIRVPPVETIDGDGKKCCLKSFAYPHGKPKNNPPETTEEPTAGEKARAKSNGVTIVNDRMIHFTFKVRAEFEESQGCACKCCVFRQYVLKHQVEMRRAKYASHKPPASLATQEAGEDCVYILYTDEPDGRRRVYARVSSLDDLATARGAQREDGTPVVPRDAKLEKRCAGDDRGFPTGPTTWLDPVWSPARSANGCVLTWSDSPGQSVFYGTRFTYTFESLGFILDACRGGAIVSMKKLKHVIEGFITPSGDVTIENPDGSRDQFRSPPRGSPPGTPMPAR